MQLGGLTRRNHLVSASLKLLSYAVCACKMWTVDKLLSGSTGLMVLLPPVPWFQFKFNGYQHFSSCFWFKILTNFDLNHNYKNTDSQWLIKWVLQPSMAPSPDEPNFEGVIKITVSWTHYTNFQLRVHTNATIISLSACILNQVVTL